MTHKEKINKLKQKREPKNVVKTTDTNQLSYPAEEINTGSQYWRQRQLPHHPLYREVLVQSCPKSQVIAPVDQQKSMKTYAHSGKS